MYKIVRKEVLNPTICLLEIEAPFVARKAQPGQFIILRIDEKGERLPLTIGGFDREKGTVTIIFQLVGLTTKALAKLEEGDALLDFVGPLGMPTEMEGLKSACVIGGGLGTAIAFPVAKGLHDAGVETDVIVGFRNKDLVILGLVNEAITQMMVVMSGRREDGRDAASQGGKKPRRGKVRCDHCHRPCPHDEIRGQDGRALWRAHPRLSEPHYDRRHRHVRRLSCLCGRQDEVRLCGRPGV